MNCPDCGMKLKEKVNYRKGSCCYSAFATRDNRLTIQALELAEAFMSGFEDDECQEGMDWKLTTIRAALSKEKADGDSQG